MNHDDWARTLNPAVAPCLCTKAHNPKPLVNHSHHILPREWGGPDTPDNRVSLCPTGHYVVHTLLQHWVTAGHLQARPKGTNQYLYGIAEKGWMRHLATNGPPGPTPPAPPPPLSVGESLGR
jgi:hypothetical protein